jgi:hypothetical protein
MLPWLLALVIIVILLFSFKKTVKKQLAGYHRPGVECCKECSSTTCIGVVPQRAGGAAPGSTNASVLETTTVVRPALPYPEIIPYTENPV